MRAGLILAVLLSWINLRPTYSDMETYIVRMVDNDPVQILTEYETNRVKHTPKFFNWFIQGIFWVVLNSWNWIENMCSKLAQYLFIPNFLQFLTVSSPWNILLAFAKCYWWTLFAKRDVFQSFLWLAFHIFQKKDISLQLFEFQKDSGFYFWVPKYFPHIIMLFIFLKSRNF